MEIWISLIGLGVTTLTALVGAAILYGKLQQRVTQLERDVASHDAWKMQVAEVGQLPEELRAIKTALGDVRVALSRLEGYLEAQREREAIRRRETLQP